MMRPRWEKWNIISDTQLKARSFGPPTEFHIHIPSTGDGAHLYVFGPVAGFAILPFCYFAIFVVHARFQESKAARVGMCHREKWKTALAGQQQERWKAEAKSECPWFSS